MHEVPNPVLGNSFLEDPLPTERIETKYRRIITPIPVPESLDVLRRGARVFPRVNCYQPPVVWDRAEGFQVYDAWGNCWIDFSSTAVMANTGHGHPKIRQALAEHIQRGLLAQFSFASEIRVRLAERLLEIAPSGMEKVYFWTTGSEAVESALRMARTYGMRRHPEKYHLISFTEDYHGCTLGAHQLSGTSAAKPWLTRPDIAIHRLPFPSMPGDGERTDGAASFAADIAKCPVEPSKVAAVFIETLQGWGALPFPAAYLQSLRQWADQHDILLVFDEIQTGFGRTGRWFAHEHYGVRPDLVCIGKGVTSTLPLAAVLGPARVLDLLPPGEVTTTHAAHPLACAAAFANIEVIQSEGLLESAERTGQMIRVELNRLRARWPAHISKATGLGLLNAIHLSHPTTQAPDPRLARDLPMRGYDEASCYSR
jgi:4-aminobutyrate aminotransferase / (S)-3-amino-2-methylpropionate transaminase / 5-aminovalerate transaminase